MAQQATDTFVITMPDGAMHRVVKGEVRSDNDPLVKHDQAGAGVLFRPLDLGDEKPPAKSEPAKAEPTEEPVKPAARAAGKTGATRKAPAGG
jgi:hypothetical protein